MVYVRQRKQKEQSIMTTVGKKQKQQSKPLTKAVTDDARRNADVLQRLQKIEKTMHTYCIGQEEIVEQVLLAYLTGQHLVLIGPPGCNKTRLIDTFIRLVGADERSYYRDTKQTPPARTLSYTFKTNLNKFSPPEELIGPPDVKALIENGKWSHALENSVADADFAFFDEVFSANGATLTSLVRILNERQVHNGTERINIRLRSVFGATNNPPLPTIDHINDRFLFHVAVSYLNTNDQGAFMRLCKNYVREQRAKFNGTAPESFVPPEKLQPVMDMRMLDYAQNKIAHVVIPVRMLDTIYALRNDLASSKSIILSERRWVVGLKALQASAWLRNATEVEPCDIWTGLRDVLWARLQDREAVRVLLAEYKSQTSTSNDADARQEAQRVYEDALRDTGDRQRDIDRRLDATATLVEINEKVIEQTLRIEIERWMNAIEAISL